MTMLFNPAATDGGHYEAQGCGGILYDPSRLRHPTLQLFDRAEWAQRGGLQEIAGGRGSVALLDAAGWPELSTVPARWVLRHYRRGGFVARFSRDAYLWSGADRTRSLREWRLLARLRQWSLPVPAPVAAGFRRQGMMYRADLITELLPQSETLLAALRAGPLDESLWHSVGRTIAAFHHHGVHHVDLNANNILLSHDDATAVRRVYLIDFDRCSIRKRGEWEQDVMARLRRSLDKAQAAGARLHFSEQQWGWLLQGMATP